MSSYRCFFEFREIHYSIAWRSLYGFRYQSCWLQFLFFLGKPWENHFISLCSYPSSLMVVGNGINRITPYEGQSKTAPGERQAKIFQISFLSAQEEVVFLIPHTSSMQSCSSDRGGLCSRDLDERWGALVPWAGQKEEETDKSHPWTRKRFDFHPWESFMFRQAKENCKFPWVPEDFLCTCEDELAAPRRAKGALTPNSS